MSSKETGELSEILVASKLLELGYIVSFPHGDSAPYDLIVDNHKSLYKIQVKTGFKENRSPYSTKIKCNRNYMRANGSVVSNYNPDDFDFLIARITYETNFHVFYIFPMAHVQKFKNVITLGLKTEEYHEAWGLLKW